MFGPQLESAADGYSQVIDNTNSYNHFKWSLDAQDFLPKFNNRWLIYSVIFFRFLLFIKPLILTAATPHLIKRKLEYPLLIHVT